MSCTAPLLAPAAPLAPSHLPHHPSNVPCLGPLRGLPTNPALADHGEALLRSSLSAMDTYWLQGGRRAFMTGGTICLADLLVAVHLDQLRWEMVGCDGRELGGMGVEGRGGTDKDDPSPQVPALWMHGDSPYGRWLIIAGSPCGRLMA